MPIYTSSKGEQTDTSTMATPHLERALAKAKRENNQTNIEACTVELALREESEK